MNSAIARQLLLKIPFQNTTRILCSKTLTNKCNFSNQSNVIKSDLPDLEIPNNKTVTEFVFQNFHKFPHKVAVECCITSRKYTYEQVRVKSNNLNKALRKKLKLQKGDVVAILLPNIPEYPICIFGSIDAGLTVTTVNPLYTPEEIQRQLLDADVKAIFTLNALWNNTKAAIKLAQKSIPIITIKVVERETTPEGAICFKELTDTKCDIEDVILENTNNTILLPYSSGTTGLLKGVEHTHQSVISTLCQINSYHFNICKETTDSHQDVLPAILPFFHIYGLKLLLLNGLYTLSKLVTLSQFKPELYINFLQRYKPTIFLIVPPLVNFMANNPLVKKEYLESTRTVASGAAPLGGLDEEKFTKKFGEHVNILQGYGLSEATVTFFLSPLRKSQLKLFGSVGEILPNCHAKVIPVDNQSKEPLGSHKLGELLFKGPQVMKGYYNKPKETNETFVEGWLRTGDLVYYDENEMFYVADRLKELIKVKGFQVAPAELEEILRSYPDIADAAVIGIPNDVYGEVPKAFVVPKSNAFDIDLEKLGEFVNGKIANFKQIRGGITVVKDIPKTASGKILRRELKKLYKNNGI